MFSASDLLLQTKLRPPRLIGPAVPRPALCARLDEGREGPLTLVCAPAGYGKTSLVVQWLDRTDAPFTWLSLDEDDANLSEFVSYLMAAIQQIVPDSFPSTEALLRLPEIPDPTRVAKVFLHDLEALPRRIILILDDYHTVEDLSIQSFMTRLLQGTPRQLHVVLITRADPVLPLARLRGAMRLVEIRNKDLRFDPKEATSLVEQIVGEPIEVDLLQELERRTEGWAVGLKLAAILLRASEDRDAFARQFATSNHQWIMQYLLDEALATLDEMRRAYLLRTALFDRFSANLLQDALEPKLAPGTGAAIVDALVRANLFIFPLDDQGIWYRFHHLFQKLLLHRLHQEVVLQERQAMLRNASAWHEAHGPPEEAIRYAIAANDHGQAIRLVEKNLNEALNAEDWRRIDHWLLQLRPESINQSPGILVASAMTQHFRHRIAATSAELDKAEVALTQARRSTSNQEREAELDHWLGAIYTIRAQEKHFAGESQACLYFAASALEKLPPGWHFMRALAEFYRIYGMQQAGQTADAIAYARRRLNEESSLSNLVCLRIMLGLGAVYYAESDMDALQRIATPYLDSARQLRQNISIGWAHFLLGWAHYQRNELREAEKNFRAVLGIRHAVHVRAAIDSFTGLALTLAASGRIQEAIEITRQLGSHLTELDTVNLLPVADSLRMRLAAMLGERIEVPTATNIRGQLQTDLVEIPALTTIRGILANGQHERIAEALEVLAVCAEWSTNHHSTRRMIEVQLLLTQCYAVQENDDAALEALGSAVTLAKPGRVTRPFLEAGARLLPYLTILRTKNFERGFIEQILVAFDQIQPRSVTSLDTNSAGGNAVSTVRRELLEAKLTYREVEVLRLLAVKHSNAEIADELTVTLPTVKKHARNIYRKLEVRNRRQAVVVARTLGLLSFTE